MSRTKRRIRSPTAPDSPETAGLLTAVLISMLMAPVSATRAQDTPTPAGQTVTRSQSPASGVGTSQGSPGVGTGSQTASGSQASGSQASPNGDKASGKHPTVCFKLTGHCVESSRNPPAQGSAVGSAPGGSSGQRPLNLNAPDIRTVVSADELKEPLPSDTQITETQESDTVSVKGDLDAPDVPGGFGALWWALNHPSQAWRIVAPAE